MKGFFFWSSVLGIVFLLYAVIISVAYYIYIFVLSNEETVIFEETLSICNTTIDATKLQYTGAVGTIISLRELIALDQKLHVSSVDWQTWSTALFQYTDWGISSLLQLVYVRNFELEAFQRSSGIHVHSFNGSTLSAQNYLVVANSYHSDSLLGVDFFSEPIRNSTTRLGINSQSVSFSPPCAPLYNSIRDHFFFFLPYFTSFGTPLGGIIAIYSKENAIVDKSTLPSFIVLELILNGIPLFTDPNFKDARFKITNNYLLHSNSSAVISCGTTRKNSFSSQIVLIVAGALVLVVAVIALIVGRVIQKKRWLEATQKSAAERELKAISNSQLKSAFLANMSHEIRTPINGIVGMTNFLLETDLSSEQSNYTSVLKHSAEVLLSIVNDILDFSKIQAGKLRVEKVAFDFAYFIKSVQISFELESDSRGNTLVVKTFFKDHLWMITDPHRLRQVISNLVSNALKFTSQGTVTLTIEHDPPDLVFTVNDTGIGMTQEQVKDLFTPFNQADISTTRKYGGTGLGLVISEELVELISGGNGIHVESQLGVGSTFSFRLLFVPTDPVVTIPVPSVKSVVKFNILVVDDNSVNRQIAKKMLQDLGHQVITLCNGQEAVDLMTGMEASTIDLIFMDSMMPIMDGYAATYTLRSMGIQVKIISMTANVFQSEKDRVRLIGCNGYVSKPVSKAILCKAISFVMSGVDYFE